MARSSHSNLNDRRVRRTRSAIVSAFNLLILKRGYARLTPGNVAAAADVGRSTFYEHFEGMSSLLAEGLVTVLASLAKGCLEPGQPAALDGVLSHIWGNRQHARALLENSKTHTIILRSLTDQFAETLRRVPSTHKVKPILDPELVALQLAAGVLAILRAWLSGKSGHSAEEIAAAFQASGRALSSALLEKSPGASDELGAANVRFSCLAAP